MNLFKILFTYYPTKQWAIRDVEGNILEQITDQARYGVSFDWNDDSPRPTEEQLATDWENYLVKEARDNALDGTDEEATRRVNALVGSGDTLVLIDRKLNAICAYISILRDALLVVNPDVFSSLTPTQQATKTALDTLWERVAAIRSHAALLKSEYDAGREIDISAGTTSEVLSGWPA